MVTIDIYSKSNGIFKPFVKANSYIINKYKNNKLKINCEDDELKNKNLYKILKNLWFEEYGISISTHWTTMTFPSKQDYEMFLLKWC